MRAGRIQVDGGGLETAWWGPGPAEAPTIVLLHEGLGCVALWRDVPERLAAATGWGVFAYSRFGYGNSDGTVLPRPMTYMHDEAREVLPEVLRAAGIKRAVLVGHSDGGSIAAIYAGSVTPSPDAGSSLSSWPGLSWPPIAASASVTGLNRSDHDDIGRGEVGNHTVHFLGLVTIAAHFVVEDLNVASIRQIKIEYETGTLRPRLARYHGDVDIAFRGWNDAWLDPRFRDFDITGFLPHIQVPVLALQGADDPYGSDEQLRILEANVRVPLTTQLVAGARHSPHLEAMDETLAAITHFIAHLPRGSST
jgi:pimeloyl-ACP methyl ester carboxylesterase